MNKLERSNPHLSTQVSSPTLFGGPQEQRRRLRKQVLLFCIAQGKLNELSELLNTTNLSTSDFSPLFSKYQKDLQNSTLLLLLQYLNNLERKDEQKSLDNPLNFICKLQGINPFNPNHAHAIDYLIANIISLKQLWYSLGGKEFYLQDVVEYTKTLHSQGEEQPLTLLKFALEAQLAKYNCSTSTTDASEHINEVKEALALIPKTLDEESDDTFRIKPLAC